MTSKTSPGGELPPSVADVRAYWEAHPLLSYEDETVGKETYFRILDKAKREDAETFAFPYWEFDQWQNQKVLDIGCGPGWVSVQYAAGGAQVTSVDLTDMAAKLAHTHFRLKGLTPHIGVASAETLPFAADVFDLVVASGVLHHTPNCQKALSEACRVAKPGGRSKITLYRKGILHKPLIFTIMLSVMRLLGVRHPGADLANTSNGVDDFIRRYDGDDNPVGLGKTDREWAQDLRLAGWEVLNWESHFFPMRFTPLPSWIRKSLHRFLDKAFGTMVYFDLRKPGGL
jgi:SAM-dependent methyltransferase